MRVLVLALLLSGCSSSPLQDVVTPVVTNSYIGATQSPHVFNYYVDRIGKVIGKMPCRAEIGAGIEPCITDTLEDISVYLEKIERGY